MDWQWLPAEIQWPVFDTTKVKCEFSHTILPSIETPIPAPAALPAPGPTTDRDVTVTNSYGRALLLTGGLCCWSI